LQENTAFRSIAMQKRLNKPYVNYRVIALLLGLFLFLIFSKQLADLCLFSWNSDETKPCFKDEPRQKIAQAIDSYNLERLTFLLHNPPPNLNDADNDAHINLLDYARDRFSRYTHTPIHWKPVFELLITAGAKIQATSAGRIDTHVRDAGIMEPAMLQYFLEKGANPNATNAEGQPLILSIIQYGDDTFEKVQLLLQYGLDLKQTTGNLDQLKNVTPLIAAASKQEWEICKLLVDAGDNIYYVNPEGISLKKVMNEYEKAQKQRNYPLSEDYLELKKKIKKH